MRKEAMNWENIFSKDIADKGLFPKTTNKTVQQSKDLKTIPRMIYRRQISK